MIDTKIFTTLLKTTFSTVLIGGIGLWSLSAVARTIPTAKDTAQQPNGIVTRNLASSSDGIAEQSTIQQFSAGSTAKSFPSYSGSVDQLTDHSRSDWQIKSASQDWLNLNRGDGSQSLVRFVIFRF